MGRLGRTGSLTLLKHEVLLAYCTLFLPKRIGFVNKLLLGPPLNSVFLYQLVRPTASSHLLFVITCNDIHIAWTYIALMVASGSEHKRQLLEFRNVLYFVFIGSSRR